MATGPVILLLETCFCSVFPLSYGGMWHSEGLLGLDVWSGRRLGQDALLEFRTAFQQNVISLSYFMYGLFLHIFNI